MKEVFFSLSTMFYTINARKKGWIHGYSIGVRVGRGSERKVEHAFGRRKKPSVNTQISTIWQTVQPMERWTKQCEELKWFIQVVNC